MKEQHRCYSSVLCWCRYDSRCRGQAKKSLDGELRSLGEFGIVFCVCFSISLSEAGLNDQFKSKARRASRVQFPRGSYVSKAILLLYSKPRGYRSRQLVTHEDRSLSCTVTRVDLASGYTLHYTEFCSRSSLQKD